MKKIMRALGFVLVLVLLIQPMLTAKESVVGSAISLLTANSNLDSLIAQYDIDVIESVEYLPYSDLRSGIAYELKFSPNDKNLLAAMNIIGQQKSNGYYLTSYELFKYELALQPEDFRSEYLSSFSNRSISVTYENGILAVSTQPSKKELQNNSVLAAQSTFTRQDSISRRQQVGGYYSLFTLTATFETGQNGSLFYATCKSSSTSNTTITNWKKFSVKNSSITKEDDSSPTLPVLSYVDWEFTAYSPTEEEDLWLHVQSDNII